MLAPSCEPLLAARAGPTRKEPCEALEAVASRRNGKEEGDGGHDEDGEPSDTTLMVVPWCCVISSKSCWRLAFDCLGECFCAIV